MAQEQTCASVTKCVPAAQASLLIMHQQRSVLPTWRAAAGPAPWPVGCAGTRPAGAQCGTPARRVCCGAGWLGGAPKADAACVLLSQLRYGYKRLVSRSHCKHANAGQAPPAACAGPAGPHASGGERPGWQQSCSARSKRAWGAQDESAKRRQVSNSGGQLATSEHSQALFAQ